MGCCANKADVIEGKKEGDMNHAPNVHQGNETKKEESKKEESKKEEPKKEEPKKEELKQEEPKIPEPKIEEPKKDEPKVEEPEIEKQEIEENKKIDEPKAPAQAGGHEGSLITRGDKLLKRALPGEIKFYQDLFDISNTTSTTQ